MEFFHTVEFYVILAFVAAAIVVFCGRPAAKGPIKTYLIAGIPLEADEPRGCGVAFHVNDRGQVDIFRYGLRGVRTDGAYSLAVTVSGFDVTIKERTVAGRDGEPAECGIASLDFLGQERYHFRYDVEGESLTTAFYLTVRPGARVDRVLEA